MTSGIPYSFSFFFCFFFSRTENDYLLATTDQERKKADAALLRQSNGLKRLERPGLSF